MLRHFLCVALLSAMSLHAAPGSAAEVDPYAPGREVIAEVQRVVTPNGVQENFVAEIGGIPQAINVRGADRNNPILLFLHGGPGAVEMPIAWTFQRPWEDYFTVVQWDQRGAGKTYALSDPETIAPTLTLERYRDDAIELINLLRERYSQDRIFLLGHSWGSALGLSVASERPDLLHAYIGMGQIVDWRENERAGFEWTLERLCRDGNEDAVRELEGMRPYPGTGALHIEQADAWRRWAIPYGSLAANHTNADFYYLPIRISPEYTPADRAAWSAGSAFTVEQLWPRLSDITFNDLTRLDTPVIMFLGRQDHTTDSDLAAHWLERLEAPSKTLVWFEHSAHLPMIEEPGRVFAALLEHVLPLAETGDEQD